MKIANRIYKTTKNCTILMLNKIKLFLYCPQKYDKIAQKKKCLLLFKSLKKNRSK